MSKLSNNSILLSSSLSEKQFCIHRFQISNISIALISHKILFKLERKMSFFQSDPSTEFLRAARAGELEKVLQFLESGVDINTSNAVSIFYFIIF